MARRRALVRSAVVGVVCATAALASAQERSALAAPAGRVALTFDDLPAHAALPPGLSRSDVARSILTTLRAYRAPATYGFVNAKGLDDGPDNADVLRLWRAAGHPLGNHTFSHMNLDTNSAAAFEQDVLANEKALRASMGDADWHWLRYPYLNRGDTPEKRDAVPGFLKEHGYRVAEVTLSFDDWAYNDPYARCAARNDSASIEWLKDSYLRRARESLTAGRDAASRLYGHDIPHVMLLHVGGFQTVMLSRLLDLLDESGLRLVTLQEAQTDPAYAAEPRVLDEIAAARRAAGQADDTQAKLGQLCR